MKNLLFLLTIYIMSVSNAFLQTPILNVDFQQGIPLNFTIVDNDGNTPAPSVSEYTSAWISIIDPIDSTDTIAASTSFFSPIGTANRWLITPQVTLGSFGNYINWNARSHDPSFPDDYLVLVSTTDNQITSFTDTIGNINEEDATWITREVKLSDYGLDNQSIYVAFVNVTDDGFKLYIDDINIRKEDPVSVSENNFNISLNVFPNPASDYISISKNHVFDQIQIISLSGQLLIQSEHKKIDINHLKKGTYIIQSKLKNKVISELFIKN